MNFSTNVRPNIYRTWRILFRVLVRIAPYLMEIYIFSKAWKITPEASWASFKHSFTCHSPGKKRETTTWMKQNGARTFLRMEIRCLSPHQHSHNSTFMSHDQSHPQDTLSRKKFTLRTEWKKEKRKKVFWNESWIDGIHKTWAESERDDHENMIKSF